jgi:cell fate regulator YaaT (PSP1 superfamily)
MIDCKSYHISVIWLTIFRDRRKLTFFFVAEKRIDFRELVRDLFKIYKTRIWMCAVERSRPAIRLT